MGYAYNTTAIDPDKLYEEIKKRSLTLKDVSKQLGFNETYFSVCRKRGFISAPALNLLNLTYNIKPEDIKPDEPKIKEDKTPLDNELLEYDAYILEELRKVIYEAVFEAVRDAVKE